MFNSRKTWLHLGPAQTRLEKRIRYIFGPRHDGVAGHFGFMFEENSVGEITAFRFQNVFCWVTNSHVDSVTP